MNIQPLKYEERKYTYAQSRQLQGQTGSIGHLRGDFDSGGFGFYSTWQDHIAALKTPEFQSEFDDVINTLRMNSYGLLQNRTEMLRYVQEHPDSAIKGAYTTEYGFRVDTKQYSYLLRCNPTKEDYNFYCFCYQRESLNRHIANARKDIRFIDSNYKELFRLPDGEQITITKKNGETVTRPCRYIDDYHMEVGDNLFHICEFAERMEYNHYQYKPKEMPLPPYCFSQLPSSGEIVKINRYEKGYIPLQRKDADFVLMNEIIGVSKAQAAAMSAGSIFGWDCPAAKPKNYDEHGKSIHSHTMER